MAAQKKATTAVPKLPDLGDWSMGPGKSPTFGAFNAAFAAVNAAATGHLVGMSPWWGLAAGALSAGASVAVLVSDNHLRTIEGRAMCYRAACWLGAGIWSFVQLDSHPWSWGGVEVLAGLAAAAAGVGEALRKVEAKHNPPEVPAAMAAPAITAQHEQIGTQWEALLRRVCKVPDLTVEGVERWGNGYGFTLDVTLPDDGTTFADIKDYEPELATAAGLEPGCNVSVAGNMPGMSRRIVHVKVNTFNEMALDQPYPNDLSPRSIKDPIELGLTIDRGVGGISLYQDSAAVVGQKGAGKSTTLNSVITGVGRCTDAVVFVIDKKGFGELPRRWQRAYHEGRAPRPVIELVANTDKLAEWMVLALEQVAAGRPGHYAQAMHEANEEKLEPQPGRPQIILIIDEFKSLPDRVKDGIEQLSDLGRSAAIEVVCCALEATAAGLPNSILKQTRERVGLRFSDESEIQYLFDKTWRSGRYDPSTMTHPGMELVSSNGSPPTQVKGYSHTPQGIDDKAVRLAPLRPGLDEASRHMFDTIIWRHRDAEGDWTTERVTDVFAKIWQESTQLMFANEKQKVGAMSAPSGGPAEEEPRMSEDDAMAAMTAGGDELDAAVAAALAAADEADAEFERSQAEHGAEEPDPDSRPSAKADPVFEALVGSIEPPSARSRYVELLKELQPTGATAISERLRLEGHPTSRQTVQGWLDKDASAGLVRRDNDGWRSIEGAS